MASSIIESTRTHGWDQGCPLGNENCFLAARVNHVSSHKLLFDVTPMMPNNTKNKEVEIDKTALVSDLKALLSSIHLEMVSHSKNEPLWNHLVSNYHYLGYQKLLGHRLKYLAFSDERPVAAFSFSAPALKLRSRDHFIGWSNDQRKKHLKRIANNSRFLIPYWVQVPHLASYLLSRCVQLLKEDWPRYFHYSLWGLETFVDPQRFKATSYKAANWQFLGHTRGSTKHGRGYKYHGIIKEVYFYVLDPVFRKHIGCQQKPFDPFHSPPLELRKMEELQMLLRHADWNPEVMPCMDLTEKDIEEMSDELVKFHQEFHSCFGRTQHYRLGLAYLSGLLSNSKAKSIEPMALEFLGQESVRSHQRFMKTYRWDLGAMENRHLTMLSQSIACPNGMINTDSSEFLKKGKESVGVARQYCGEAGKTDNCQSGVFVGYSSRKGYGLLTSQLYMPKIWFSKEYDERREFNLVPSDLEFQTKPQIALGLINKIADTGLFPAQWIGCDATFGSDINFLNSLPREMFYFAGIRSNTQVFLEKPEVGLPPYKGRGPRPKKKMVLPQQPEPQAASKIAQSENIKWLPVVLTEGAKGPIIAEVVALRVYLSRDGLPEDDACWLFIRRNQDGQKKYAISNAPEDIPFSELCEASTMRWPIEQCFEEGKSHLGMGDYEHRSWPAWHRHMMYVFLGLHFILRLRLHNKKKSGADSTSSSKVVGYGITSGITQQKRGIENHHISHKEKSCRQPVT
jgi:SRSO17 transposase